MAADVQQLQRQFGRRVRELRTAKGWSQEGFADRCGLHRTYMGTLERGETNPTLTSMFTVAKTLEMTLSDLLTGVTNLEKA